MIARVVVAGIVAAAALASPPARAAPPAGDALVVTFADVGEGDAIVLRVGEVELLVDAGPRGSWKRALRAALAPGHGRLAAMFLTHPHDDHYGAAMDVLDHEQVAAIYTNGERRGPPRDKKPDPTWAALERAIARAGLAVQTLSVGDVLRPAPGLAITVMATGSAAGGEFPDTPEGRDINDDSLVLMVEYGGVRILLAGDVERRADRMLVKRFCARGAADCPALHADVVKVPHHGSANFDPAFFAAVAPAWAVVSAGHHDRKHCLPRVESIDALHALGARVLSTSSDGDEDIVLTVTAAGATSWTVPAHDVFAWRAARRTCKAKTFTRPG